MFKIVRRRLVPAFTYHDSVMAGFRYKYHPNPCNKIVIDDMWFNLQFADSIRPPSDGLKFFLSDGHQIGYDDEQTTFHAPESGYFSDFVRQHLMNEVWLRDELNEARERYLIDQTQSVSRLLTDFTEADITRAMERFQF